jgi:hypothetical protein
VYLNVVLRRYGYSIQHRSRQNRGQEPPQATDWFAQREITKGVFEAMRDHRTTSTDELSAVAMAEADPSNRPPYTAGLQHETHARTPRSFVAGHCSERWARQGRALKTRGIGTRFELREMFLENSRL